MAGAIFLWPLLLLLLLQQQSPSDLSAALPLLISIQPIQASPAPWHVGDISGRPCLEDYGLQRGLLRGAPPLLVGLIGTDVVGLVEIGTEMTSAVVMTFVVVVGPVGRLYFAAV